MSIAKPTIVFVTGAWHKVSLYSPLTSALESAGYSIKAPVLPSIGGEDETIDHDVAAVREAVQSSVEAGQDVIVLMHSYGGVVGSEAVKGFSRLDKPSGDRERGSVVRMIYLCAFALAEKTSLMDGLHGEPMPWWGAVGDKQWKAINCHEIFYNDVEKERADEYISQLEPQAKGPMSSKISYAAWKHISSTYIICEKDNAIPMAAQEGMATQPGNKFEVLRLDASHSPFYSKLEETVKLVRKACGEQV